jgi:ABC-2 type transport system permease protein
MRREGSPWQGVGAVILKDLADQLTSARMRVIEWLIVLSAMAALYGALQQIRDTTAEDQFLYLRLFTTARDPLPSLVSLLVFLVPIMAIGIGFDAINGEYNRRTMSRILAQPIYRDALLLGKFLSGMTTLAISMVVLWLVVTGLGLLLLGLPPGGEEMLRSLAFLGITVIYGGIWLTLAMLLSVIFRSPATAALVALGLWLFFTFLWPVLAPALAEILFANSTQETAVVGAQVLARLSPSTLYGESVLALLNPSTRALGPIYLSQLQGAVIGAPLPFGESLLVAWPQIVMLISAVILLFVASYVTFQRQEVRA